MMYYSTSPQRMPKAKLLRSTDDANWNTSQCRNEWFSSTLTKQNACSIIEAVQGGESRFRIREWPPCMAQDKTYTPFDPILRRAPAIPYRPSWNRLTGSPFASILLQQIVYRWQNNGRKPFSMFTAPCPSAKPGKTWVEELGITRRRFEAARARIATKVTTGDSKREALKTALVLYYTGPDRRTWYEVNESLLLRRLAELEDDASRATAENRNYMSNHESGGDMSICETGDDMVVVDSANTCTNKELMREQPENGVLDQELLEALTRLGDANPQELVSRYPAAQIRRWLAYCNSPTGKHLLNKPGFIRYKLGLRRHPEQSGGLPQHPEQGAKRHGKPTRAKKAAEPTASSGPTKPVRRVQTSTQGTDRRPALEPADPEGLWAMCLADLRCQMTRDTFDHWLRGTHALDLADGTLRVAVKNEYAKDWLDHRLRSTIEKTLDYIAGHLCVEFVAVT